MELVHHAASGAAGRIVVLIEPALARDRGGAREQLHVGGAPAKMGGDRVALAGRLKGRLESVIGHALTGALEITPHPFAHRHERHGDAGVIIRSAGRTGLHRGEKGRIRVPSPFLKRPQDDFTKGGIELVEVPRERFAVKGADRHPGDERAEDLGKAPLHGVLAHLRPRLGPAAELGEDGKDAPVTIHHDFEVQGREAQQRGRKRADRFEEP